MNEMWSEMSESCREEYRDYFIAYHNGVAKTGITGKRIKPVTVLPRNVIKGFENALLVKVRLFFTIFSPGIFLEIMGPIIYNFDGRSLSRHKNIVSSFSRCLNCSVH